MEENKKKSNVFINVIIIFGIIIVSVFIYAKYFGTSGVRVHEYRISNERIPVNFSGVKLVYFSDFLYSYKDDVKMIEEAVDKINELKPDIVLFGGGLVFEGYVLTDEDKENMVSLLSKIEVSLGKYAVRGFNDDDKVLEVLNSSGFLVLDNVKENIYINDVTPICLVGVSSYVKGLYNLDSSFNFMNDNQTCYTIMFTHEGDIIENIRERAYKPDVIFAGNSLGGEIRVPFYGGLFRNEGNTNYYEDRYEVDGMDIYISSGFGTSERGMRLNNKPSFNFFRLKSLHS